MSELSIHIEHDLIRKLQEGSSQAFQLLFDKYGERIYRFSIGYLKNEHDAEEIVQEVFLKLWNVREEISFEKSFDAFVFTIAKNAILNTIRKAKSEQLYLNYAKLYPSKNVLLDEELDFNELNKAYQNAIDQLSPRRKKIFLLSRSKNMTNAEIARQMGISVKTVENQMTSALSDIRRHLSVFGFSAILFFEIFSR